MYNATDGRREVSRSPLSQGAVATIEPQNEVPVADHYRSDVDGLRAIAVSTVVLYHLQSGLAPGGYVGVDVFFVISGFLIFRLVWEQLEGQRFSVREFYVRRVLRLLPASLAMVAIVAAASSLWLLPSDLARVGRQVTSTMAYGSNFWFWRNTGYFDPSSETMPLLHTWSLAVEEQFYFLAPLTLVLCHRYARRWVVPGAAMMLVATLVASEFFVKTRQPAVFYLTPFRSWEFLCGGLLALARPPPPQERIAGYLAWVGLALIVVPVFFLSGKSDFPGLAALAPCVGAAVLLWLPPHRGLVRRALESRQMVVVGRLSYSLYLWHWPVFTLWNVTHPVDGERPWPQQALKLVLSVALGVLSYLFVEQPLRTPLPERRRQTVVGAMVVSGVLLLSGLALTLSGGIPSRFGVDVQALDRAREQEVPFVACFGPDAPAQGDCRIGAKEAPTRTLLWGDSHALALAPALDEVMAKRGESAFFIASSTCPPILGLHARDVRQGDWRCERTQARVEAVMSRYPEVTRVILASIWESYFDDESTVRLADQVGERGNSAVLSSGLSLTVATLASRGLEVMLVRQVPKFSRSVPQEMARAAAAGEEPKLRLSLAEVRNRQSRFDALVAQAQLAAPPGKVATLDLPSLFCDGPGEACRFASDGVPLYRDAHHLNMAGAREVASALSLAISPRVVPHEE